MPECIHGLDLASCDACTPKKAPEKPEPVAKVRAPRAAPLRAAAPRTAAAAGPLTSKITSRDQQRLHVALSLDEFGDMISDGELVEPTLFHGPEEQAWRERRRAKDVRDQVVLVTTYGAIRAANTLKLDAVQLIAVANTVSQERVRELLSMTEYSTKVSVYPPWFQAPED